MRRLNLIISALNNKTKDIKPIEKCKSRKMNLVHPSCPQKSYRKAYQQKPFFRKQKNGSKNSKKKQKGRKKYPLKPKASQKIQSNSINQISKSKSQKIQKPLKVLAESESQGSVTNIRDISRIDPRKLFLKAQKKRLIEKFKKDTRICSPKGYITTVIILTLGLFIFITWNNFSQKVISKLLSAIDYIIAMKFPFNLLIIVGILLIYLLLSIPGLTLSMIALSNRLKNIWVPFLIIIITRVFAALMTFALIKICFKSCLRKKFKRNILYIVVEQESKKNPVSVSLMIRWMGIQPTLKNILISLGDVSFLVYLLTHLSYTILDTLIFTYVGFNLKIPTPAEEAELVKGVAGMNGAGETGNSTSTASQINQQSFKEKTFAEKMSVVITYLLMVFTGLLLIFICFYTGRKIREYRKKELDKLLGNLKAKAELKDEINRRYGGGPGDEEGRPNSVFAEFRRQSIKKRALPLNLNANGGGRRRRGSENVQQVRRMPRRQKEKRDVPDAFKSKFSSLSNGLSEAESNPGESQANNSGCFLLSQSIDFIDASNLEVDNKAN